jgi:hypothetical protein
MAAEVFPLPVCQGAQREWQAAQVFYPPSGQLLTLAKVRDLWRPSGTVIGAGVVAVVWSTQDGCCWARLHDFEPGDPLRLVEDCRRLGVETFGFSR